MCVVQIGFEGREKLYTYSDLSTSGITRTEWAKKGSPLFGSELV
jgi:hypothetical protein